MTNEKSLKKGWKILKFSECIQQLNTGLNPRKHFSLGVGNLKYITAKNLTETGRIDFSKCDYIDENAKKIINRRSDIRIGDILFSSRAPIGHCHLIKEEPDYYDIGESIFSIRVKKEIVLPEYLCLYLSSDFFVKLASKNTTGSIISEIRITDLMNTSIIVPPIDEQSFISNCLNTIDRKIELNDLMSNDLQEMAETIYNYWFVQFDFPDENGKPYKSSGGKMKWCEQLKVEVPDMWEISTLKGKYSIERGLSYTSKDIETGDGIPMINLACIDINRNYRVGELKYHNGKVSDADMLQKDDLLIACTDLTRNADIVGSPILVPDDDNEYTYSMDIAKMIPNPKYFNRYYLYMALRTDFYHNYIKKWASGTNVLHLNLDGIEWYTTWIPSIELQEKYANIVKDIHKKKSNILKQNQELSLLRQYLLPLLMNGQLGIKEA